MVLNKFFEHKYDKEVIANLLKLDPSKVEEFEAAYKQYALDVVDAENVFAVNAKQAAELMDIPVIISYFYP